MNKFHKSTKEMKYIKMQWKEKINAHQEKTYSNKEKSCLKDDSTKYDILEILKKEGTPGPYTNEDKLKRYLLLKVDDDMKNKCISDKVKYARISCISLEPIVAVQLNQGHKNLAIEEYSQ